MSKLRRFRLRWLGLVGVSCLVVAAPAGAAPFVYVADDNTTGTSEGAVSQYDAAAGPLARLLPSVRAGLFPVALAVTPAGTNVYVLDAANPTLAQGVVSEYDVNADGTLAPKLGPGCAPGCSILTVPTGFDPAALAVSPDGKSVYVANCGDRTLSEFDIGPGGVLAAKSPAIVGIPSALSQATRCPDAVAVSPDGRSVYVADRGGGGGGAVSQFDVVTGGVLSLKTPFSVAAGNGPSPPLPGQPPTPGGVAVSLDGKSVYVTNAGDGTVSQYSIGAGGTLTPQRPATVAAGNDPLGIALSPDSQSVYVADEADGLLSEYVAAGAGLTPKAPATLAAGINPVGVAINPDGKSVYVTDMFGLRVFQYSGGSGAGALAPSSPVSVEAGVGASAIAVGPAQLSFHCANVILSCTFHIQPTGNAVIFTTTIVRAAPVGILVERFRGKRRVRVGRVPFGLKHTGRLKIRWNLSVNGHRLQRGRYRITLRMFDHHQRLIALARPVEITLR